VTISRADFESSGSRAWNVAHLALLSLTFAVLIRTAWISDDAEITLRCVMNFIHGYGPTFNIDERVQAFTHPLWFLLISGVTLVTGNIFAATFIMSIALSLLAWWLLISRVATNAWTGMLAGTALLLSKAYVDYSTSGLENPLSHLLLVYGLFLGFKYLESDGSGYLLTASLTVLVMTYLSRPDLVLVVFPFCLLIIWVSYRDLRSTAEVVATAIAPVLLWVIFSVFYYGAPFPNTAHAKLGTGITLAESVRQGMVYLGDSFSRDPITLSFISIGIVLAIRGPVALKAIAVGIALYLAYVVSIGGDFMSGRFLTVPLLASAVILSRSEVSRVGLATIALAIAVFGATSLHATILSGAGYSDPSIPLTGITDERGIWYPGRGIITATPGVFAQPSWEPGELTIAIRCGQLGDAGLHSGPSVHFVDPCGLADPLLARLPARSDPNWRIGHPLRQIPTGYVVSLLYDKNLLMDPATRSYWDTIRSVTRGPIFSLKRLENVARLNLGLVEKPDPDMYLNGPLAPLVVDAASLDQDPESDEPWFAPPNTPFESSIEVRLPRAIEISSIDVSLSTTDLADNYLIEYQKDGAYKRLTGFGPIQHPGMARFRLKLPQPTAMTDRLRISGYSGDGQYAIGHLFLNR
jgi:arabinofuranosyltransferase